MTYAEMIADGIALEFIREHAGKQRWLEIKFPDGSWEIVPATDPGQVHQAIVRGAHQDWMDAAWERTKRVYGKR